MLKEMTYRGRALCEQDMVRLEIDLGVTLPADFGQFLAQNNGGRPVPDAFPTGIESEPFGIVHEFLNAEELVETYWLAKPGLPNGILPIGRDPCNSYIALVFLGELAGAVVFCRRPYLPHAVDEPGTIHRVADSFETFLDSLFEAPPLPPFLADVTSIEAVSDGSGLPGTLADDGVLQLFALDVTTLQGTTGVGARLVLSGNDHEVRVEVVDIVPTRGDYVHTRLICRADRPIVIGSGETCWTLRDEE